jgi:hypothetical protein
MFDHATVVGGALELSPVAPRFRAPDMFPIGNLPYFGIAPDINGDGKPDIVTINRTNFSVLINTHEPPMREAMFAPQQLFIAGNLPSAIDARDLNGDDKPDLVIANQDDNTVSIFLNETLEGAATAEFSPQQVLPTGLHPAAVALADINGDGKVDLVVGNQGDGTLDVRFNTTPAFASTATFGPPVHIPLSGGPFRIAVVDINGDGKPDLMVADYWQASWVLINTTVPESTTATFGPAHPLGIDALSFAACNVSGDGKPDIVGVEGQHGWVWVLTNETVSGATESNFAPLDVLFQAGQHPIAIACGDTNNDGKADLVVADQIDMHAYVYVNTTRADYVYANGFD